VALATSWIDSVLPTPNVLPALLSTVQLGLQFEGAVPVPVQLVLEKTLAVSVKVVPAGPAKTFTFPSVNVVCAVHPEVSPLALTMNFIATS
jgi:hypothetical protein